MQPLQLTTEGRCIVHGARFRMPEKPKAASLFKSRFDDWGSYVSYGNLERGGDFSLRFDSGVPEGEEWRGDWLAVVEKKGRYVEARTFLTYEITEGGSLRILQALGADCQGLDKKDDVRTFLLG